MNYLTDKLGFVQSLADPCILTKFNRQGRVVAVIAIYVDDCLIAGEPTWIKWCTTKIKKKFNIKEMGAITEYVGATYERNKEGF